VADVAKHDAEEEGEGDDSEGGRGTPYVSMISWKAEVTLLTRK